MIVKLLKLAPSADISAVEGALKRLGQWSKRLQDHRGGVSSLLLLPPSPAIERDQLLAIEGVIGCAGSESPHPLVDQQRGQPVTVAGHRFGESPLFIAGPCSVESEETAYAAAALVAGAGGRWLRGGAFKPRSSPYAFQGVGEEGLRWLRAAADAHQLALVTEALSEESVPLVARYADVIQIGTRNMQNFALLKAIGAQGLPTLLKRGFAATIEEWLLAGEYLLHAGGGPVIFCERGLRSFDSNTRNLLDLAAVALLKHSYQLPVIVDPSHAAGRRDLVAPLSAAALAAGADGVIVEAHPDAGCARSDGPQALDREACAALGAQLLASAPLRLDPLSLSDPAEQPGEPTLHREP